MSDPLTDRRRPAPRRRRAPARAWAAVRAEVAKAVVGQDAAVSGLLVALLCGGHVLMEGVPGVAKTLLVRTPRGRARRSDTKRVQFTPDLMPGDITGSMVIDSAQRRAVASARGRCSPTCCWPTRSTARRPRPSPRCSRRWRRARSPSTGVPRPLPRPFLVAATQNPVEYEGTYPLPEAQLDRFLLKVVLPLPERDDELADPAAARRRLRPARHRRAPACRPVAGAGRRRGRPRPPSATVAVSPEVAGYVVDIARATRGSPSLSLGVSPRGATALLRTSRAWAWLQGRTS